MTNEDKGAKDTFEQAAEVTRDHDIAQLKGDDKLRVQEISERYDRQLADERQRFAQMRPLEVVGETNRLLLEQSRPELRPDGIASKPRSYEQLNKLAESNCDRRHEAALAGIVTRRDGEMDALLQGSARRGPEQGGVEPSPDLARAFTQEAAAPGDARGETNADREGRTDDGGNDLDFGGFYRGAGEREGGRER